MRIVAIAFGVVLALGGLAILGVAFVGSMVVASTGTSDGGANGLMIGGFVACIVGAALFVFGVKPRSAK